MTDIRVPFLDLRITSRRERSRLLAAVKRVFDHGRMVMGPEVDQFEKAVAERVGRRHAVGVGSGTDALFLGLKALGIGPGDEVITTSLSWIATANAVALTGARPIFADIGDDLNIDPASVERLIGPATKAVMPVHYTGRLCRMRELEELCQHHGLHLVEDASQAFDASREGRTSGSIGVLACYSMNPMKVFAACGEAGVVLTDRDDLHERLVALRYNGTVNRETCIEYSLNARLDTLQAAILLERLESVEKLIARRRRNAARYDRLLRNLVDIPPREKKARDVYYTYTIQTNRRDELKAFLEERGVETKIQHPILMPEQPAYREGARGEWTNAARLQKRILCLPIHEKLIPAQIDHVAAVIRDFHRR